MPATKKVRRSVVEFVNSASCIRLFRRKIPEVEASRTNRAFRSVGGPPARRHLGELQFGEDHVSQRSVAGAKGNRSDTGAPSAVDWTIVRPFSRRMSSSRICV